MLCQIGLRIKQILESVKKKGDFVSQKYTVGGHIYIYIYIYIYYIYIYILFVDE